MTVRSASRAAVLGLVLLGAGCALALREQRMSVASSEAGSASSASAPLVPGARVVELGSTSCQSCRAMHGVMAVVRRECAANVAVEEIDVLQDEEAARRYGVSTIPTQVFFDAEGREFERHVGFLTWRDIRQRFADRGVECQR